MANKKNRKQKHQAMLQTVFSGTVTALSHEGRGIVHIEGQEKPFFVDGALIGEQIELRPSKIRRRTIDARVSAVHIASTERVPALCVHADLCGGCSLQHMSQSSQLAFKQQTLLAHLSHIGKVTPLEVLAPVFAEPWGYRRKARLGVNYCAKKDKLFIGFRENNSQFLIDLQMCKVLHPRAEILLQPLHDLIRNLTIMRHIPQIEIAIGSKELACVIRHLQPLTDNDRKYMVDFAKRQNVLMYSQPGNASTITLLHPVRDDLRLHYQHQLTQQKLQFFPTDFIQVNEAINELLIQQVLNHLDLNSTDRVLDLFCGVGNITLPLATKAGEVVGIEGEARFTKQAMENAHMNGLTNVQFYEGNLFLDQSQSEWMHGYYNKLVIDPPRSGAVEIIRQLSAHPMEKIVYVSCNPATLARDAGVLVHEQGYRLTHAGILDMFPHTAHVESIAVFTRQG